MLQRLGKARSAKAGDQARTTGPGGNDGASARAALAAVAGPGAANGAADEPGRSQKAGSPPAATARAAPGAGLPADFDLAAHDPLRAFLLSQAGAVDITRLEL